MDATEVAALNALLAGQRVAALATLHGGEPAVSMVPFAKLPDGSGFVVHVSRLATHTRDMIENPAVALLVTAPLAPGESALALPRASIKGRARPCPPGSDGYQLARASYLAKLPDAQELFGFSDFSLFVIEHESVRYVAGFGRAMTVSAERMRAALGARP